MSISPLKKNKGIMNTCLCSLLSSSAFPWLLHFQKYITSGIPEYPTHIRRGDIKSMDKPSFLLISGQGILRDSGPWRVKRELCFCAPLGNSEMANQETQAEREGWGPCLTQLRGEAGLLVFSFPQICFGGHQDWSQLRWSTFLYPLQRKMLGFFQRTRRTATGCKPSAIFRTL